AVAARPEPVVPRALAAPAPAGEPPRAELVKVAENVFELRNGPATRADTVAAAAAIVTATTRPASTAAAATVIPVRLSAPETIVAARLPVATHTAPASSPATPASSPGAPGSSAALASPPAGLPSRPARYEIANGHGGEGLARRLAGLLAAERFARPRLTNHLPYNQPASYVAYRDGYRDEAEAFAARLPFRPQVLPSPSKGLAADVRLLLGRDLTTSAACAVLELCPAVAAKPSAAPRSVRVDAV
uniref:LytR C-terminal domain-containing protein n=1 Tax=Aromatoleum sp. TaxID=2307007 RepID=UPI002FCC7B15